MDQHFEELSNELSFQKRRIEQQRDDIKSLLVEGLIVSQSSDTLNSTNPDANVKVKLHQLQAQYSQLKRSLNSEQSKYILLQSIAVPEENTNLDQIETELKSTSTVLRQEKERLQDLKNNIEELSDRTQEDYERLQKRIEECSTILDTVMRKKAAYEEKLKLYNDQTAKNKEISIQNENKNAEIDRRKNDVLQSLEEKCSNLRDEIDLLREAEKEIDLKTNEMKKKREESALIEREDATKEWYRQLSDVLGLCHGMKIKEAADNTIVVECFHDADTDQQPKLEIRCQLEKDSSERLNLRAVHISENDLPIDDIVKVAVEKNDIGLLIKETQVIWQKQYPLLQEMETLREKYAIDWMFGSRTVKVLFGKTANIMCTVRLAERYPVDKSVLLESVEGLAGTMSLEDLNLQINQEYSGLDTLLNHLLEVLNSI